MPALLAAACGGDDSARAERVSPRDTVARWVDTGDCALMTDRYVAVGFESVDEGRRACQVEADKTAQERYTVQRSEVRGREATVVLDVEGGHEYVFWLVDQGERGWRIDDFEERRAGQDNILAREVIAAFERRTGERLERLPELSGPAYLTLGFPEIDAAGSGEIRTGFEELAQRWGFFYFHVAPDVLMAKRVPKVTRRYRNVVLRWSPYGPERRDDPRIEELHSILREAR